MDRDEITKLLSELLVRDVLYRCLWVRDVRYRKLDGSGGHVDFMSFKTAEQVDGTSEAIVQGGSFTCYEVRSCMQDLVGGNGLNLVGDWNCLVMPMKLYKKVKKDLPANVSVYCPLPACSGQITAEMKYGEYDDPTPLSPYADDWKLAKIKAQAVRHDRRHGTAELLYAMLKAGK